MTNELECSKCGEPVKVVPAGISKRTGRSYNSFYKCKSCGNSVTLDQKPIQEPAKPQMPLKPVVLTLSDDMKEEFRSRLTGIGTLSDGFKDELRSQLTRIENLLKEIAKFQGMSKEEITNKSLPF